MSDKVAWPELVGNTGEAAKAHILADDSSLNVIILPEGSFVTMDFNERRVRIYVDGEGNVISTPRRG